MDHLHHYTTLLKKAVVGESFDISLLTRFSPVFLCLISFHLSRVSPSGHMGLVLFTREVGTLWVLEISSSTLSRDQLLSLRIPAFLISFHLLWHLQGTIARAILWTQQFWHKNSTRHRDHLKRDCQVSLLSIVRLRIQGLMCISKSKLLFLI